jgi:outer membrane protein TolC
VRGAQVAIAGDLAEAYVGLRAAQNTRQALSEAADAAGRLAGMLETGAAAGLVAEADAADARRLAAATLARIPDLAFQVVEAETQIALLRGRAPGTEPEELAAALAEPGPVPAAPLFAAPSAPADLLRARPDVAEAEALALAAAAEYAGARADLLPQISLTGALSIADNLVGGASPERLAQLRAAPAISIPLFDWGRRMSAVRVRDARLEQALLGYQTSVSRAAAEASTSLSALSLAEDRLASAAAAEQAAALTARGVRAAFEAGIVSLADRLRADQQMIDARVARIGAQAARARAAIGVYRAFGGGPPDPALASSVLSGGQGGG